MARKKSPVDHSDYSGTLATCPECQWREWAKSRAFAWYALARHLKHVHGDYHASENARRYFFNLR